MGFVLPLKFQVEGVQGPWCFSWMRFPASSSRCAPATESGTEHSSRRKGAQVISSPGDRFLSFLSSGLSHVCVTGLKIFKLPRIPEKAAKNLCW